MNEREQIAKQEAEEITDALRKAGVPKAQRAAAIETILGACVAWRDGGHSGVKQQTEKWCERWSRQQAAVRTQLAPPMSEAEFTRRITKGVRSEFPSPADQAVLDAVRSDD